MNTGSLILHQWIVTQYPEIVHSYEQFNNAQPLAPISLACAIPSSEPEKESSNLTAVVAYKIRYTNNDKQIWPFHLALGQAVKVNSIIGLPTFKEWKLILDLDANCFISKSLVFTLTYAFRMLLLAYQKELFFNPITSYDSINQITQD